MKRIKRVWFTSTYFPKLVSSGSDIMGCDAVSGRRGVLCTASCSSEGTIVLPYKQGGHYLADAFGQDQLCTNAGVMRSRSGP